MGLLKSGFFMKTVRMEILRNSREIFIKIGCIVNIERRKGFVKHDLFAPLSPTTLKLPEAITVENYSSSSQLDKTHPQFFFFFFLRALCKKLFIDWRILPCVKNGILLS